MFVNFPSDFPKNRAIESKNTARHGAWPQGRIRKTAAGAVAALAIGFSAFGASTARASSVTLQDGNSSVTIDPTSQAGQSSYVVNGINTTLQDWFWYRIGSSGPEQSIDTLSLISATPVAGDPSNPTEDNVLDLQYAGSGFDLSVQYVLEGGTQSSLNTIVSVTNTGGAALDLHLFEYADMSFANGATKDDTLAITGGNTVDQSGPAGEMNTVGLTQPSEVEAALGTAIKDSLNDSGPTTLNGATGPITGDATWAFEWDDTIAPAGSYIVSQAETVSVNAVPLPKAVWMSLASLGAGALLLRRRMFAAI